jgi:hypothetical protein
MIDGTNYKTAYASGMKEEVRPPEHLLTPHQLDNRPANLPPFTRPDEHDRQRAQLLGYHLPNRIRHLPTPLPDHLDQDET